MKILSKYLIQTKVISTVLCLVYCMQVFNFSQRQIMHKALCTSLAPLIAVNGLKILFADKEAQRRYAMLEWISIGGVSPHGQVVKLIGDGSRAFKKRITLHIRSGQRYAYEYPYERDGKQFIDYWIVDEDYNPIYLYKTFCVYDGLKRLDLINTPPDRQTIRDSTLLYGRFKDKAEIHSSKIPNQRLVYFLMTGEPRSKTSQVIDLVGQREDVLYRAGNEYVRVHVYCKDSKTIREMWEETDSASGVTRRGVTYWSISLIEGKPVARDELVSYVLWQNGQFLTKSEIMSQKIIKRKDRSAKSRNKFWNTQMETYIQGTGHRPAIHRTPVRANRYVTVATSYSVLIPAKIFSELPRDAAGKIYVYIEPFEDNAGNICVRIYDDTKQFRYAYRIAENKSLIPAKRVDFSGKRVIDIFWRREFKKFVHSSRVLPEKCLAKINKSGLLRLSETCSISIDTSSILGSDKRVQLEVYEKESGQRYLLITDIYGNFLKGFLLKDTSKGISVQPVDSSERAQISTQWRTALFKFLTDQGSAPESCYADVNNRGCVNVLTTDKKISLYPGIEFSQSDTLPGMPVRLEPVEYTYEDGSRAKGIRLWAEWNGFKIPFTTYILSRNGSLLDSPQYFPVFGRRNTPKYLIIPLALDFISGYGKNTFMGYDVQEDIFFKSRDTYTAGRHNEALRFFLEWLTSQTEEWRSLPRDYALARTSLDEELTTAKGDTLNLYKLLPDPTAPDPYDTVGSLLEGSIDILSTTERRLLRALMEAGYGRLPKEIVDGRVAKKTGTTIEQITVLRAKLRLILALETGMDTHFFSDISPKKNQLLLQCLPLIDHLLANESSLYEVIGTLSNRLEYLLGNGWTDNDSIVTLAVHGSEKSIVKATSQLRESNNSAEDTNCLYFKEWRYTTTVERQKILAQNAILHDLTDIKSPTLAHQLLGTQIKWDKPVKNTGYVQASNTKIVLNPTTEYETILGTQNGTVCMLILDTVTGGFVFFSGSQSELSSPECRQSLLQTLERSARSACGPYHLIPFSFNDVPTKTIKGTPIYFSVARTIYHPNHLRTDEMFMPVVIKNTATGDTADILIASRLDADLPLFSVGKDDIYNNGEPCEYDCHALPPRRPLDSIIEQFPEYCGWIERDYTAIGALAIGTFNGKKVSLLLGKKHLKNMRIFMSWNGDIILYRTDTHVYYHMKRTESGYVHETDGLLPVKDSGLIPLVSYARDWKTPFEPRFPALRDFYKDISWPDESDSAGNSFTLGAHYALIRNMLPFELFFQERVCRDLSQTTLFASKTGKKLDILASKEGLWLRLHTTAGIHKEFYPIDTADKSDSSLTYISATDLLLNSPLFYEFIQGSFNGRHRYHLIGSLDPSVLLAAVKNTEPADKTLYSIFTQCRTDLEHALETHNDLLITVSTIKLLQALRPGCSIRFPKLPLQRPGTASHFISLPGECTLTGPDDLVVFEKNSEAGTNLELMRLSAFSKDSSQPSGLDNPPAPRSYILTYRPDLKTYKTHEGLLPIQNTRLDIFTYAGERDTAGNLSRPDLYNFLVERLHGRALQTNPWKVSVGKRCVMNIEGCELLEQRKLGSAVESITIRLGGRIFDVRGIDGAIVITERGESTESNKPRVFPWPLAGDRTLKSLVLADEDIFELLYNSEYHYRSLPPPAQVLEGIERLLAADIGQDSEADILALKLQEAKRAIAASSDPHVQQRAVLLMLNDLCDKEYGLWKGAKRLNMTPQGGFSYNTFDWMLGKQYLSKPEELQQDDKLTSRTLYTPVIPFVMPDGSLKIWRTDSGDILDIAFDTHDRRYSIGGVEIEPYETIDANGQINIRVWLGRTARQTNGNGFLVYDELFRFMLRTREMPAETLVDYSVRAGLVPKERGQKSNKPLSFLFNEYDQQHISITAVHHVGLTTVGLRLANSRGEELDFFVVPEGVLVGGTELIRPPWRSHNPDYVKPIVNFSPRGSMTRSGLLWSWYCDYGNGYYDIEGIKSGLERTSAKPVHVRILKALCGDDGTLTKTGALLVAKKEADFEYIQRMLNDLLLFYMSKGDKSMQKTIYHTLHTLIRCKYGDEYVTTLSA